MDRMGNDVAFDTLKALQDVEKTLINASEVQNFANEDDFISLAMGLLIEAGSYVCVAIDTASDNENWDRDMAAIGGNMVRLYKMISALLDQTTQRRRDTSSVFARLIF